VLRLSQKGDVEYLESGEFSALGFVTHAFCTRNGGVSTGPYSSLNVGDLTEDRDQDVRRNIGLIEETFAIPEGGLILMRQVHGDKILILEKDDPLPEGLPECDGLITDRPGVALGVRTADCAPVLFVDPVRRVVGAAHAGWRGTALGIAAKMVEIFVDRYASRREDLLAVIGPAIGPCCYQVDSQVCESFSAVPGVDRFIRPSNEKGRWMMDLSFANRLQIEEAGVPSGNIFHTGLCTACRQDLFFSHRGSGGRSGRQLNLLMLTREARSKNT
jgi:YfiH family protein